MNCPKKIEVLAFVLMEAYPELDIPSGIPKLNIEKAMLVIEHLNFCPDCRRLADLAGRLNIDELLEELNTPQDPETVFCIAALIQIWTQTHCGFRRLESQIFTSVPIAPN